jgi:hypothetical protein
MRLNQILRRENYRSHEASMMRKRSHAQTVKLIAIAVEINDYLIRYKTRVNVQLEQLLRV